MLLHAILASILKFGSLVFLALGALLPIVDPLGGAPIYLAMTQGLTSEQRIRMAKAVALNSFVLLMASAMIGAYVLDFFGVSIPAVQVAGGIVVCAIGWQLLNSSESATALDHNCAPGASADADADADALKERAFYPMTMPLTVGPGSISVAITLGANPSPDFRTTLSAALAHAVGIVLVSVSVYLCYRYAEQILSKIGKVGTGVFVRLSAFILLCIGVQICWNGIHSLVAAGFKLAVA